MKALKIEIVWKPKALNSKPLRKNLKEEIVNLEYLGCILLVNQINYIVNKYIVINHRKFRVIDNSVISQPQRVLVVLGIWASRALKTTSETYYNIAKHYYLIISNATLTKHLQGHFLLQSQRGSINCHSFIVRCAFVFTCCWFWYHNASVGNSWSTLCCWSWKFCYIIIYSLSFSRGCKLSKKKLEKC